MTSKAPVKSKTPTSMKAPESNLPGPSPGKSAASSKPRQNFATRMAESAAKNLKLAPCKFCNRKFADNRLEEHERICARIQKKPRKPYDARRHRLSGTIAEGKAKSKPTKAQHPPNNWKKKHEEFLEIMKSAIAAEQHLAKGGKAADLPPPPASDYSDYTQCPYCGRRFNQTAAQRHIPNCKDMIHNKPGASPVGMNFKK